MTERKKERKIVNARFLLENGLLLSCFVFSRYRNFGLFFFKEKVCIYVELYYPVRSCCQYSLTAFDNECHAKYLGRNNVMQ